MRGRLDHDHGGFLSVRCAGCGNAFRRPRDPYRGSDFGHADDHPALWAVELVLDACDGCDSIGGIASSHYLGRNGLPYAAGKPRAGLAEILAQLYQFEHATRRAENLAELIVRRPGPLAEERA